MKTAFKMAINPTLNSGSDMAAHYQFSGPAIAHDFSGHGLEGTLTDCTATFPGLDFNGSTSYLDTTSAFQTTFRSSFSVMSWIKLDDGQAAEIQNICGTNNAADEDSMGLFVGTSGIIGVTYQSNNDAALGFESSATFANGQSNWKCIAGTFQSGFGGALKIYVDGQYRAATISTITFANYTSADELWVGGLDNNNSLTNLMSGLMGQFSIWNRLLSATEILNAYNMTKWRYGR